MPTAASGTVGVVGLGYVGLTTAVCFAGKGIPTVGIEINEGKLGKISRGEPPFSEAGLASLLRSSLRSKKFRATSDYRALRDAGIVFITVNTPSGRNGSVNLAYVEKAARSIGLTMRMPGRYKVVVVKSTVTPGTTENLVARKISLASRKKPGEFGLAVNPEFLREGRALQDTMSPNRLVIGTVDSRSRQVLVSFYRRFYGRLPKTVFTSPVNAELIKYASNSFLATKITFANQIADLAARYRGADIKVVAGGMGLDKRISPSFLNAGLGYGGSCFPKDVDALLHEARKNKVSLSVVSAAQKSNRRQHLIAIRLAERLIGSLKGKRVALLGLAFKPESDDMREAVSVRLTKELLRKGARVVAYDPIAVPNARRILGRRITYAKTAQDCLAEADCCILVTEWKEFTKLQPETFKRLMKTAAVVDGRRILEPRSFTELGVKFAAVGLGS